MQPCFLVVYGTYTTVFVALYQGSVQLALAQETHKLASKNFTYMIDQVFESGKKSFSDLAFIAANRGPGPFTTLRTVIALVNGLAFATKLPVVGVDNISAFVREYAQADQDFTVALLNAFCDDVYYAQYDHATHTITQGCTSITQWIELWNNLNNPPPRFALLGNGVKLHYELLQQNFNNQLPEMSLIPENASIEAIARCALQQWESGEQVSTEITPLYLKEYSAKINPAPVVKE